VGIFDLLFGRKPPTGPKIPAPELKLKLIRSLVKKRVIEDEAARQLGYTPAMIDSLSVEVLTGIPEATIVTIVDAFAQLKIKGMAQVAVLNAIERSRTGGSAENVPDEMTLEAYVEYRINREHGAEVTLSPKHIFESVELTRTLYRC
jgi:hypothetical protein